VLQGKDIDRFVTRIDQTDSCWIWTGSQKGNGYGEFHFNGTSKPAHRVSYEFFTDTRIPFGKVIDHLCRNPICVNPLHLEPVSQETNTLRGEAPSAKYARATHCDAGHPLSGDNLKIRVRGRRAWRVCRTCKNRKQQEYMLRKRGRPIGKPKVNHL